MSKSPDLTRDHRVAPIVALAATSTVHKAEEAGMTVDHVVMVVATVVATAMTEDHDQRMATATAMSGRHLLDHRASNVDRMIEAEHRVTAARAMMSQDGTSSVTTADRADHVGITSV